MMASYSYRLLYKNNFRAGYEDWQPVHEKTFSKKADCDAYAPPEEFWKYRPGGGSAHPCDCYHEDRGGE